MTFTGVFRKRSGRFEEWHFQPDCPDWPAANYIEQITLPPATDICIECVELHNSGSPDPQLEA
jgi:hypothetical protein